MADVFSDITAKRVWAVEVKAYDPSTEAEITLYAASKAFTTKSTDTPADTYFPGAVGRASTFERSMFRRGRIGGSSMPDPGALDIVNTGELETWLDYQFDGRDVTVKVGLEGDAYSTFETVFSGVSGELQFDRNVIRLKLSDKQDQLDKLIQENLFAGTGGNEGGDDLKDKPKPLCFGPCNNITPVIVDRTNRVYQVHDGQIKAVDAVYDNGKLLTLTTHYTVDLTNGRITLVAAPTGLVTADIQGSDTGGTYVSSVANIMERIVKDFGGLSTSDIDATSISDLNTKNAAAVGIYTGTGERNLLDVLDELSNSIGAFYGFNRAGKFSVGRFEAPATTADFTFVETDAVKNRIKRDPGGSVIWRQRIKYGRNWTVQSDEALDASATDAHKDFVTQDYRVTSDEDADVKEDGAGKGGHKNADDPEPLVTLLDAKADADTEATRLLGLYDVRRDFFSVTVKTQAFQVDLGDTVDFSHSRFGLSAGKKFLVVGIAERAVVNEADLDLWG